MIDARATFVLAVLALVSACGSASSPVVPSGGPPQIHGWLEGVGGPAGVAPRHWSGTVTLTAADGAARTVHTDAHGRFDVAVLDGPGRYTLTGHSPTHYGSALCQGVRTVEIHEFESVHVDVMCQLR
jgi:hypothetical protein